MSGQSHNAMLRHARTWACAILLLCACPAVFAAVGFRAATSASATSGTAVNIITGTGAFAERTSCGNITPSIPAGSVGDLLIAQVVARRNAATITMPGWNTLFAQNVPARNYQAILFWRIATNTVADTNTITQAGTCNQFMGRITRFRNVDTVQPFETLPLLAPPNPAANWAYSNAEDVDSGSQEIGVAKSVLVLATFVADNRTVSQDVSFTQLYDVSDNSGDDAGFSLNIRTETTTGTVGPFTNMDLSGAGSTANHGVLFAVRPSPSLSNPSLTIARPAGGTTSGDILVATIAVTATVANIPTPPGWTAVLNSYQPEGGLEYLATYWRVITDIGSEPANYTWTFSASHAGAVGGIAAFSGVNTSSPIVNAAAQLQNGNTATAHAAPSINANAGDMLVTSHSYTSSRNWTPPAGMTEAVDRYSAAAAGAGGVALEMNYLALIATSPTGVRTATAAGNGDEGVSHAIALNGGVSFNHVRILHDGEAATCAAETVTIRACVDAGCSSLYTSAVTVDLDAIVGATWSDDPVALTSGEATVRLTKTTAGAVTLGGVATSPPAASPTACYDGITPTCTLTYASSSACFDTAETGANPVTPLHTKLSNTAFSLDVMAQVAGAVDTAYGGTVLVDLVNPAAVSGNCGDTAPGLTAAASYTFVPADAGRKAFNFNYPHAAGNVRVRVRDTSAGQPTCSSDNFAIRPTQFALSTPSALNPLSDTIAAGADFGLAADPGVASGYVSTASPVMPDVNEALVLDHDAVAIAASTLTGDFVPATGASASGTFQYLDVGTITLGANAVFDSTFTAVDQVTGISGGIDHGPDGDCIAGSMSNTPVSGRYGCSIGSTALGPLGRFRPDHFEVTATLTAACDAGTVPSTVDDFTYMGQPQLDVGLEVKAMASSGSSALSRYTDGYPTLASIDVAGEDSSVPISLNPRLTPDLPALQWSGGIYSATGSYSFDRGASPDGPYDDFKLRIVLDDPDAVKVTSLNGSPYLQVNADDPVYSLATRIRYGRLRLLNAYGSPLLPLLMPVRAEYFNGGGWSKNTLDTCTALTPASVAVGGANPPGTALPAVTSVAAGAPGIWTVKLTPDGATISSFDIALNLGAAAADASCNAAHPATTGAAQAWLRHAWCAGGSDPNARIKFGAAKSPHIYLRERY